MIELLAPAGDLQRLMIAVDYGADAVFVGGKMYSLRAKAGNFDLDELAQGAQYCHAHGARLHVTVNIVPHPGDLEGIEVYLRDLQRVGVDAIICASISVLTIAKRVAPGLEVHISTQDSSTNSAAVAFYRQLGADRVVLGRECTLEEVDQLIQHTDCPIETFVHGGMCTNFSGHCTLSNYMTGRDANRGGCAQSCRWSYDIYDQDVLVSDPDHPFTMSSKDMNATQYVADLMRIGVTSLKIEGRMKTDYYIASVVSSYRRLIDDLQAGLDREASEQRCLDRLRLAQNRETCPGYYGGIMDETSYLYGVNGSGVNQDYLGTVIACDDRSATIEVRNHFSCGDWVEVLEPTFQDQRFVIEVLQDSSGERVERVYKPMEHITMRVPTPLAVGSFIRRINS